jgi:hypothetical protein
MRHGTATLAGVALLAGLVSALPARAEHMTLVPRSEQTAEQSGTPGRDATLERTAPATPSDLLDLDLKLGAESFRLGARFFGATGVWGAWLNGQSRPDGFSVDGRVQQPERGYNFKMNAEIDAWARRALERFRTP